MLRRAAAGRRHGGAEAAPDDPNKVRSLRFGPRGRRGALAH